MYDERIEPAVSTLYCRVKGITYSTFKYQRSMGFEPSDMRQYEDALATGKFRCETCDYFDGSYCTNKKFRVEKNAICKQFYPDARRYFFKPPVKKKSNKKKSKKTTRKLKKKKRKHRKRY